MKTAYFVPVIESESGWGSKVDDYMVCPTLEKAKEFVVAFNAENYQIVAPEWYMRADDSIFIKDIPDEQFKRISAHNAESCWAKYGMWKTVLKL